MYVVLIFDADNILWDTNSVFHEAHVAMLEVFKAAQLLSHPKPAGGLPYATWSRFSLVQVIEYRNALASP